MSLQQYKKNIKINSIRNIEHGGRENGIYRIHG